MILPNEQSKQLTFEIPVSDIKMRAKQKITQAVSIDDKPVLNKNVHLILY